MNNKKGFLKQTFSIIRISQKSDKSFFPLVIFRSLVTSSFPFVAIIYSALILDALIDGLNQATIMTYVYQMVAIGGVLILLRTLLNFLCNQKQNLIGYKLNSEIAKKTLNLDYEQLESQAIKDKMSRADQGVSSNGGISTFINAIGRSIENIISFIYSFILILALFNRTLILNPDPLTKAFNNPLVGVILFILIFISLFLNFNYLKKVNTIHYEVFEKNVEANRIAQYLVGLSINYRLGKDIRIYKVNKLIMDEILTKTDQFVGNFYRVVKKSSRLMSNVGLLNHLILFAAYSIIGIKALLGLISVGSVLRLVSAITVFNTAITAFLLNISAANIQTKYLTLYDEYLNTNTDMYKGTLPIEKRSDNQYALEFKNVTFHYPNSEEIILHNVSLKLDVGKKLAIVGPNGAGKTTFIKLLCRLYDPTEGEILLNGINIKKYDHKEYVNLLSIVFQDFRLFSTTIKENVTSGNEENPAKIIEYLIQAGLEDKIDNLDKGIDTFIYSNFGEEGIEISGGEAQKLAIARALYKDTPLVILDEPTSALDPISEYEIYTKFDGLVDGKTAIYISHRMSSCKFCDNIIVFDKGVIIQEGNHEDLLNNLEGLYCQMWSAQAKYYN
ncbi:ABC transporter ATP-binding protein [Mycoplasmatota bacterium WC30]